MNCANQTANYSNCSYHQSEEDIAYRWLMYFLHNLPLIILGILTISANSTILIIFTRKRQLKTATNFFLAAIAFSDLLAGLVGIPTYMACNVSYGHIKYVCEFHASFFAFTCFCSITFIAVITADRYIAILMPLRYKALITKKLAKMIISVVMVISLILSLLPHIWVRGNLHYPTADHRRADFIYTVCILVPMCSVFPLMVYAYIRIFLEIRRQHKMTQMHERFTGNDSSPIEREIRTVCIFVIMLIGYVFCWTPFGVVRVNLYISKSRGILPLTARYILQSLPFVTSLLNPCCYGLGKKDFRRALTESTCVHRSNAKRQGNGHNTLISAC